MTDEKAKILRWCRKKTAPYADVKIKNFNQSWTNGLALCSLIHSLKPDFIDIASLKPNEVYTNICEALDIAQQAFAVTNQIEVSDIAQGNEDIIFPLIRKIYVYTGGNRYMEQFGSETEEEPEEELNEDFLKYDCSVCMENFDIDHGIVCSPSGLEKAVSVEEEVHHQICVACLQGQAEALCADGVLAPFGTGLCCVEPNCKNIYQWAIVSEMVTPEVRDRLGNRIETEVMMALKDDVERCKSCNFTVEFLVPANVDPIFDCWKCAAKFCRLCQTDWSKHVDLSCAEATGGDDWIRKRKQLENDLTNAITRKCHRCGLVFAKEAGCNKMTCRCGAKQCYVCRATDIDYSHFGRGCDLWTKRDDVDRAAIDGVKNNAARDPQKQIHLERFK